MEKQLEGKTAIITGAAGGIGSQIARAYGEQGASLVLSGRNKQRLDSLAAELESQNYKAIVSQADVTEPGQVDNMVASAIKNFGQVDILVNNAGGAMYVKPPEKLKPEEWNNAIALNLTSVFLCSQAVSQHMIAQQHGSIINISSVAGMRLSPAFVHYGAAKAGTNSLTWTLAAELAPDIRVNAVAPGAIPTEVMLTAIGKTENQLDEVLEEWNIPLGRLGTPQDIGAACVYLASDAASWVSGEIIRVGGGARPR